MSRRSHTTLRNTERAREAARDALSSDRSQREQLQSLLAARGRSFSTKDVVARLDRLDAEDRARTEHRLASAPPPLDLGER